GRFGEIELKGTEVQQFNEKPLLARGRINGGFFVFHRRLFKRLENDPELVFEQEPLRPPARDGGLGAYLHDGFWQPRDNSREYQYLNELWAGGKAPWATWRARRQQLAA